MQLVCVLVFAVVEKTKQGRAIGSAYDHDHVCPLGCLTAKHVGCGGEGEGREGMEREKGGREG